MARISRRSAARAAVKQRRERAKRQGRYERQQARKRTDALKEFWVLVERSAEPRLALLQRFATVHIPLGREHARATRRRFQHRDRTKEHEAAEPCFVCGKRATQRHHIIQVQHGGTNRANNLVPICGNCHTAIHPWLGSDESAQPVVT